MYLIGGCKHEFDWLTQACDHVGSNYKAVTTMCLLGPIEDQVEGSEAMPFEVESVPVADLSKVVMKGC